MNAGYTSNYGLFSLIYSEKDSSPKTEWRPIGCRARRVVALVRPKALAASPLATVQDHGVAELAKGVGRIRRGGNNAVE